jgi:hypothetical protein
LSLILCVKVSATLYVCDKGKKRAPGEKREFLLVYNKSLILFFFFIPSVRKSLEGYMDFYQVFRKAVMRREESSRKAEAYKESQSIPEFNFPLLHQVLRYGSLGVRVLKAQDGARQEELQLVIAECPGPVLAQN